MGKLVLLYLCLLCFGSFFPFDWQASREPLFAFLARGLPPYWDKGDMVQNVLVYMPFGLAIVVWRRDRSRFLPALLAATVAGTLVSVAAEVAQQFLASRVSSLLDIVMNFAGTLTGGLLAALIRRDTRSGAHLLARRDLWFRPGPPADVGLVTLGLWVLAQTSPLVPSLHVAHLRHGAGRLLAQLHELGAFDCARTLGAAALVAGVGLLLRTLVNEGRPWLPLFAAAIGCVLAAKLLVAGRTLSLETLVAFALALCALALLARLPAPAVPWLGIALLSAAMASFELAANPGYYAAHSFNWMPFLGQMQNLNGFENIIEFVWPSMAMACLLRGALPPHRHRHAAIGGAAATAIAMFALEWAQLDIPGRSADITQVLLPLGGWIAPWCVPERRLVKDR